MPGSPFIGLALLSMQQQLSAAERAAVGLQGPCVYSQSYHLLAVSRPSGSLSLSPFIATDETGYTAQVSGTKYAGQWWGFVRKRLPKKLV